MVRSTVNSVTNIAKLLLECLIMSSMVDAAKSIDDSMNYTRNPLLIHLVMNSIADMATSISNSTSCITKLSLAYLSMSNIANTVSNIDYCMSSITRGTSETAIEVSTAATMSRPTNRNAGRYD